MHSRNNVFEAEMLMLHYMLLQKEKGNPPPSSPDLQGLKNGSCRSQMSPCTASRPSARGCAWTETPFRLLPVAPGQNHGPETSTQCQPHHRSLQPAALACQGRQQVYETSKSNQVTCLLAIGTSKSHTTHHLSLSSIH